LAASADFVLLGCFLISMTFYCLSLRHLVKVALWLAKMWTNYSIN